MFNNNLRQKKQKNNCEEDTVVVRKGVSALNGVFAEGNELKANVLPDSSNCG